jgi:hypothetical protein
MSMAEVGKLAGLRRQRRDDLLVPTRRIRSLVNKDSHRLLEEF